MRFIIPLLLASQFMILPNLSFRWIKECSAQIMIILTLCSLIWKKNKSIALFIAWSLFIFFYTKSLMIADATGSGSFHMNPLAFLNMTNVVLYGIFYYVLHQIKIDKDKLYKTFAFIAVFQSVYVILQFLQIDQFFNNITFSLMHQTKRWPVGMWGNEALVSWCIAICSPFLLAFKELRYKLAYVLCFGAVCCTRCSAGIAAFILGFIFFQFFNNKKKLAIALLILVLLSGAWAYKSGKFTYYFNPTHRFEVWKKSVEIWHEMPITGWGLGSYRVLFWQRAPEFRTDGHWAQTHNDYLQTLFETGVVGFGILLSLLWITFHSFWRKRKGLIPITSLFITSMIMFWGFPFRTALGILPIVALVLFERERDG